MAATIALRGSRIAFLAAEELNESDVTESIRKLEETGARVELVGSRSHEIPVFRRRADGVTERISVGARHTVNEITPKEYGAVALPAALLEDGWCKLEADVRNFVLRMQEAGKLIVCLPAADAVSAPPINPPRPHFDLKKMLADSWQNWNAINAPRMGAALAFYSVLSLAPLLVLTVAITGLVFRRDLVQTDLIAQVRFFMGQQIADLFLSVLKTAKWSTGVIAGAISIVVLLIGSSGVFLELRDSLDTVWGVKPNYGSGLLSLLRERAFAFVMTLGTGVVMIVLLLMSAILSTPARFFLGLLPHQAGIIELVTIGGSFFLMTFFFALVYKVIPDIAIPWGDVWIGAAVTSALFTSGRLLIGLYLSKAAVGSTYAAAASLIVFLTWVYYSAQIFLFGAEFTHVYSLRHGSQSLSSGWSGSD